MIENDWKFRKDSTELRDSLCEYFETLFEKVRFLEEKNIGKVRADMIAVIPEGLIGIEIKSHCDSYTRLQSQIKNCDKYCDFNYLFVGSRHIHAADHVPNHWGVVFMNVRNGVTFEIIRQPVKNIKCKVENQLTLLWHWRWGNCTTIFSPTTGKGWTR